MKATSLLPLLLAALLSSCKSGSHTAATVWTDYRAATADTLRLTRHETDTLLLRDSIYIKERTCGDTVYITQFRDRLRYKTIVRHDTVYSTRRDTVATTKAETRTVSREVPARLTAWQRFRLAAFYVLAAIVAAVGLLKFHSRKAVKSD